MLNLLEKYIYVRLSMCRTFDFLLLRTTNLYVTQATYYEYLVRINKSYELLIIIFFRVRTYSAFWYHTCRYDLLPRIRKTKKRIFHGVMVTIGKVEPEGWPVRSGPSFSEVQITGLPEGSTFPILANDPVIDYFSCLSTLIDRLTP